MSKNKYIPYFYGLVLLLLGVGIYLWRSQPKLSDRLKQEDLVLISKWNNYPYIKVAENPQFKDFINKIPTNLATEMTLEQDKKLRDSIFELLIVMATADHDRFLQFQKSRQQFKYNENKINRINTGRSLPEDASLEDKYLAIWKDIYKDKTGFVEAVSTTATELSILPRPPGAEVHQVARVIVEQNFTTNAIGGFTAGNLTVIDRNRLEDSASSTVAVLITTVRLPEPDPAVPWMFVFEYQTDINNWVLVFHRRFFIGPSMKYFPFL